MKPDAYLLRGPDSVIQCDVIGEAVQVITAGGTTGQDQLSHRKLSGPIHIRCLHTET